MKSKILLSLLSIIIFNNVQAIEVKGILITKEDTSKVTYIIPLKLIEQRPDYYSMQSKIIYINNEGEKIKVKPDQAEEVRFTINSKQIRMISTPNTVGKLIALNKNIFLKLERELYDGRIKIFNYYHFEGTNQTSLLSTNHSPQPSSNYYSRRLTKTDYVRIDDKKLFKGTGRKLKKAMKKISTFHNSI